MNVAGLSVRRTALLIVAGVVVACELWAASTHVVPIVRDASRALRGPDHPVQAADVDSLAFFAPTAALIRARNMIPPHATYTVVGPGHRVPVAAIAFKFALLPRVYTADIRHAQWVITYHRSSESLGIRYSEEIGLAPQMNIVKAEP